MLKIKRILQILFRIDAKMMRLKSMKKINAVSRLLS